MKVRQFHEACRAADLASIESLLAEDPQCINSLDDKYGWTPLCRAIICGHRDVVKQLLRHGADPNCKTAVGEPPLYVSVDMQQLSVVQLLLDFAADPNCTNADGETPLHLAAFKGQLAAMELLLAHGADPDVHDLVFSRTPLHIALERDFEEGVQLLTQLKSSAAPSGRTTAYRSKDQTPASPISSGRSTQISQFPEPRESRTRTVDRSFTSVSSRSASAERRVVHERINELDQLNLKIMSVLNANEALDRSLQTSEVQEPEIEKRAAPIDRNTRLAEWLRDIRLEATLEPLVENGFDDFEVLVEQQRSGFRLTSAMLKDIGVQKPGHRMLLLAALDLEVQGGCPPPVKKRHRAHTYSCLGALPQSASMTTFPSLQAWLGSLNLSMYVFAFEKSGFEHLDQLLALMQTPYRLTESTLESEVGIKKLGHRHRLLGSLQELSRDADPVRVLLPPRSFRPQKSEERCGLM